MGAIRRDRRAISRPLRGRVNVGFPLCPQMNRRKAGFARRKRLAAL
jgi:hypothetical protein